jgi:hypothetical protein
VDRKELFRMAEALADTVIERHRKRLHSRARLITLDLDPTDDPYVQTVDMCSRCPKSPIVNARPWLHSA